LEDEPVNVAVIGCGNIGTKRARAVAESGRGALAALVELRDGRRRDLADEFDAPVASDYRPIIHEQAIDAVIVATPPSDGWRIALESLQAGKHVLCEKPLGRSVPEAQRVTDLAQNRGLVLKCGFNLRHDEGLGQAFKWIEDGRIGTPYFLKCAYVNGAVAANANRVGSLLDMGTHVLDLVRWFLGDLIVEGAALSRCEYGIEDLDDNGFAIVRAGMVAAALHFSFVRWQNAFVLEVSGASGAVEVVNLPKWGTQTLTHFRRVLPSGAPALERVTFHGDRSWTNEWQKFVRRVETNDLRWNGDGLAALRLAEALRAAARPQEPRGPAVEALATR